MKQFDEKMLKTEEQKVIHFFENEFSSPLSLEEKEKIQYFLKYFSSSEIVHIVRFLVNKHPNITVDFPLIEKNLTFLNQRFFSLQNRPLTLKEKEKMHDSEKDVIRCFERTTKLLFMRHDVIILKELLRIATPAQISSVIIQMKKTNSTNFKDFSYIVRPVENFFFGKRGRKSYE